MLRRLACNRALHSYLRAARSGHESPALQLLLDRRDFCKQTDGDKSSGKGERSGGKSDAAEDAARAAAAAQQAASDAAKKVADATSEAARTAAESATKATEFASALRDELLKNSPFGKASAGAAASGNAKSDERSSESDGACDRQASSSGASSSQGSGNESADSSKAAGTGFSATAFARRLLESARRIIPTSVMSGSGSAPADGPAARADVVARLRSEVAQAVLPVQTLPSVMKRRTDVAGEIKVGEGTSELVISEVPKAWYDHLTHHLGNSALLQRIRALKDSEAAKRMAEGYEDVREKLENSDSEVLGRLHDFRQRMSEENEAAVTYREIRLRHPSFDMPNFLHAIKQDVPIVIKAYLEGSEDVLKEYCSDAMLERLLGIYRATTAEGQITDSTILEYSDVDMVDMKMLENDPVIILHFSCQQINCVRDQYGNVISGAPDDVNRVYYYWAVQQDGVGSVSTAGEYIPPRWKLTEMLLRGMHQLL